MKRPQVLLLVAAFVVLVPGTWLLEWFLHSHRGPWSSAVQGTATVALILVTASYVFVTRDMVEVARQQPGMQARENARYGAAAQALGVVAANEQRFAGLVLMMRNVQNAGLVPLDPDPTSAVVSMFPSGLANELRGPLNELAPELAADANAAIAAAEQAQNVFFRVIMAVNETRDKATQAGETEFDAASVRPVFEHPYPKLKWDEIPTPFEELKDAVAVLKTALLAYMHREQEAG